MVSRLHPHVAVRPPTGWVPIDLHSHTMWSGDASTTADEVAEAGVAAGIEVRPVGGELIGRREPELIDLVGTGRVDTVEVVVPATPPSWARDR